MLIKLFHKFSPRYYQSELAKAVFIDKFKHIFWIVHRRAGKTKTAINTLTALSQERVGTHLYLFPQTNQARRVIWKGIDGQGMRFLDHIPQELIIKKNNSDMSVELINGSIIQLGGSNNYDALMGTNPVSITYDEFPLHNPMAREYLSPILVENGGLEIILGTPRGKNHAYKAYQYALNDSDWFTRKLTVDDTRREDGSPIITPEQIKKERDRGVPEEIIRQEYFCDFNVGVLGAYFTREMDRMELDKRILSFEYNKNLPVFTSWDLGVNNCTSIIFFQVNGDFIDIIYFISQPDKGVQQFVKDLDDLKIQFGFRYQYHFAPHDIMNREWSNSARSRLVLAREAGINFLPIGKLTFEDGIEGLRSLFPRIRINKKYCQLLIDACIDYRREWDPIDLVYKETAYHNWASDPVDALRYLATAWRDNFAKPDHNTVRSYKRDFSSYGM